MSDKFSAGVQILLKRIESNPDEFKEEHGKWSGIREGVFRYKEQGERNAWLRGLTNAEIDALYEKLSILQRAIMDEWVMKEVLREPEERQEQRNMAQGLMAQGKRIGTGWNDPRMLARNTMAQNAIQPGTMISVTAGGSGGSGGVLMQNNTQVKPESVMSKLKRELGL
jgi:hypothetical protein